MDKRRNENRMGLDCIADWKDRGRGEEWEHRPNRLEGINGRFLSLTLTAMVAAKSVPQNHLADPFEAALRPPPGETPAQRDARILAEQRAKQVSDAIDERLRIERAELKKSSPDVRILLLGQSESGKSTTLKRTYSTSRCGPHMSI